MIRTPISIYMSQFFAYASQKGREGVVGVFFFFVGFFFFSLLVRGESLFIHFFLKLVLVKRVPYEIS